MEGKDLYVWLYILSKICLPFKFNLMIVHVVKWCLLMTLCLCNPLPLSFPFSLPKSRPPVDLFPSLSPYRQTQTHAHDRQTRTHTHTHTRLLIQFDHLIIVLQVPQKHGLSSSKGVVGIKLIHTSNEIVLSEKHYCVVPCLLYYITLIGHVFSCITANAS